MAPSVTVQLKPEVASGGAAARTALDALVHELGVSLRVMHADTDDSTLSTYFTVDVPDGMSAEHVAARLRDSPAVAAAYVKPAEAMP